MAGEGGKDEHSHGLVGDEPGVKAKKSSKVAASFFTPLSKKVRVAASVEVGKKVEEERKDDDFQEPAATLATVSDIKPSKKKAKVGKDQKKEVENAPPLLDAQTGPDRSLEQKHEMAASLTKNQSKASPSKKKRKAQQNVIDNKPCIGVHGSDLFLQARLAAEENARLSAGKATHPFFARPKAGGAGCLVTDETAQSANCRSLYSAPDRAEKTLRSSPLKPPHPFFARQTLGSVKASAVDESSFNYETDCLHPCLPFHITQNSPEEDEKLAWSPNWTRRNMPVKSGGGEIEGTWSFSSYQPSYTWTWPSSKKRKRRGEPISEVAAFGRVIEYLRDKEAGLQYFLGEEVESETQKLVEKFSTYYYPHAHIDSFEQNSALLPFIDRQVKSNSSRNPLWTDQYQPHTSQEVCGNKECVKRLSAWLQSWGEKILQQKGASKNKEQAECSSSDDDSDFEDSPSEIDDNDDLHNCLLVTGPVGCGKSAAIYACSMEHGFTVIEVNASECRSGALIKHKFKEAMESHGLSKRRSSTPMDASDGQVDVEQLLKLGEPCRRSISFNEEPENQLPLLQSGCRNNLPPSSLRGLRVILFEDVDIVFEEDSGFMGALVLLARTSKCPIIFSSNSKKPVLPQVRSLQEIRFEHPSMAELVAHTYMVCMAEGVSCSPYIIEHIVKTNDHDLRKLLMLLQFWAQGSPSDTEHFKDANAVKNLRDLHISKQNPNLVNCLLQLDGCPQVPATRIHTSDKKLSHEELNSIGSDYNCKEEKPWNDSEKSDTSIFHEPDLSKNLKKRSLDSYWLYSHDCQHRVLPLLFPNTEPCELTARVSICLEDFSRDVTAMMDHEVAQWSCRRFNLLQVKEDAEFQARKALRKLQAAARKEAKAASESFSFTKLIQSSYDSPAAQSASNECIKDTLSLFNGHESSSSEEREADFVHDEDMCELRLSGVDTNGPTLENEECMNLNSRSSSETEWMIRRHNCIPRLDSDVINLGVNSSQLSVDFPVATAEADSQSTHSPVESSVPLGIEEACVYAPSKGGEIDLNPVAIANLTIHNDVENPSSAGEQSCEESKSLEHRIRSLASSMMEERWSALRGLPVRLQLNKSISPDLDTNVLLDEVLHDLSACDFLSSRTASGSKASTAQQTLAFDDYTEDIKGDNCTESAAVIAQLRLNQALNKISSTNGLFLDTWQVGPSVSQQEAVREEKQSCEDERVDLLLPQRCRLIGRLARLDYFLFQSQLTPSIAGRATRQRKLT